MKTEEEEDQWQEQKKSTYLERSRAIFEDASRRPADDSANMTSDKRNLLLVFTVKCGLSVRRKLTEWTSAGEDETGVGISGTAGCKLDTGMLGGTNSLTAWRYESESDAYREPHRGISDGV
ncbi:hypothetical protein RRG08_031040 [Elysia crispata]|uniref:Uncharacterized protein n=1 Tax=Elysia crispata TaxID=231223 RepID=A0AAE0ZG04_9GAST|nr:hypothetical protein RRG08_031040 [Elysia crispata]